MMPETLEICTENQVPHRTLSYSDLERDCLEHMAANGIPFQGSLVETKPGAPVRFSIDNKKNNPDEFYYCEKWEFKGSLYLKCIYGTWEGGKKHFTYKSYERSDFNHLSPQEYKQFKEDEEQREREFIQAKENENKERIKRARNNWEKAQNDPSHADHTGYLNRKQVEAFELKYSRDFSEEKKPVLVIPIKNIEGELYAVQYIWADGEKKIYGIKKGNFHVIGQIKGDSLIYCSEGYASAFSVFKAEGFPVVVAFDCGNLDSVIGNLRGKYPKLAIIIAADNDKGTKENPGRTHAEKAAKKYNCSVILPEFPDDFLLPDGSIPTDFNDLHVHFGINEVKKQIAQAIEDTQTESVELEDQSEEFASGIGIDDTVKAKASARRKALNFKMRHEIIDDICKQYPEVKDQAEDIAKKAIEWSKKQQIGCIVKVKGISKKITDLKSLNERFAQLEAPCQPCVTIRISDGKALASTDLTNLLSSEIVVSGVNNRGDPNYISASTYWKGDAFKKIYRKIAFTSKPVSEDTYNLFTGFGVKPKQGKCEKILNHIEEVLCAGNKANSLAFIKKTAWEVQNIGEPSRVPVLLKSKQHQTGKGIYLEKICLPMFGNSGFKPEGLEQLTGRFNDPMRGKAFIYLDEVLFAGDIKSADKIKSLVTAKYLGIESKGLQTVQAPIGVNLYLTTNHEGAAYIEELDERYWILEVSPDKYGDDEYFKELLEEVENGGLQAFLYYLLNLDVTDFLPWRDVPKDNEFKDKMIRDSVNPYDARKWVEECCHARMILGLEIKNDNTNGVKCPYEPWETGTEYENGLFLIAYANWQKTVRSSSDPKPTKSNSFGELLNNLGFIARVDKQRYRKLPDPDKCLENLVELPKLQKEKQRKKRK